jgi:hypothetical protein
MVRIAFLSSKYAKSEHRDTQYVHKKPRPLQWFPFSAENLRAICHNI